MVKFGHEYAEEGENLIVIPEEEGEINVAWFMYEFIALSIPMKHVHAPGKCNKAMTSKLSKHLKTNANEDRDEVFETGGDDIVIEEEVEEQIDPRWNELKKKHFSTDKYSINIVHEIVLSIVISVTQIF